MSYSLRTSQVSYYKLLRVVISRWYWLLIAIIIGIVLCYLYLLITPKQYRVSAVLKYDEKKSEISELLSVRNLYDRTNKIESEKGILLSKAVLRSAISSLNYQVIYFEKVNMRMVSIYPRIPLKISFLKRSTSTLMQHQLKFRKINLNQFELCYKSESDNFCKISKYGLPIAILGNVLTIHLNALDNSDKTVFFEITNSDEVIETILKSIKIDDSQNTNILKIRYVGSNSAFCTDILNAIIDEYLKFDVRQKEIALSRTSKYLDILLKDMSDKSKMSANALQTFKESNNLVQAQLLATENQAILEKIRSERHITDVNLKILNFVSDHVVKNFSDDPPTYNLQGLEDPQLREQVEKYNELNVDRFQKLNVYSPNSAPIIFLNKQINDLKASILKSLNEHKLFNTQKLILLGKQSDSVNRILRTIPKLEKLVNSLISSSELDQKIEQFIAQKKIETQIVNAAVTSLATILDRAEISYKPLLPIAKSCYLVFTLLSIIIGTIIIVVIHLYNPFIYTKEDLEGLTSLPILGVVNKSYNRKRILGNEVILKDFPRSSFSESIRFIRGNLNFMEPDKGKVICITSAISGEGKSFISINLAYALTLIQKKVVIIAADLRKSELHLAFDLPNLTGLSEYLSGQTDGNSIISSTSIIGLDIITAGPIPPNPSELLQNQIMNILIHELKQIYDVIIIDSAPIGLVSDIKPVMRLVDVNLFVMRSGISKPAYVQIAEKLKDELKLHSMAIILNDFKSDDFYNHYYKDSGYAYKL